VRGAFLPGDSTVELREVPDPRPGARQVLVRMRASTLCGSDLRAIYREHLGSGPEAYQGVIAGHEPAGEVVEIGPDCHRIKVGARVAIYHISGCGQCEDCRRGYLVGCSSPLRAAYGWQRDGGHADLLLAQEDTCIALPDSLSFLDGACVACGFGTAYEALCRAAVSGRDRVLVTGLGPVGLAAGLLAGALGSPHRIGVELAGPGRPRPRPRGRGRGRTRWRGRRGRGPGARRWPRVRGHAGHIRVGSRPADRAAGHPLVGPVGPGG